MKQKSLPIMLLVMLLLFAACGGVQPATPEPSQTLAADTSPAEAAINESNTDNAGGGVQMDAGLLKVEITLPASFFENQTEDEVIASAAEGGIVAKVNPDGSYTYSIPKAKYNEIMLEMKLTTEDALTSMTTEFGSLQDVQFNKDFSEINLYVDRSAYEGSWDSFAVFGAGISAIFYQYFDGKDASTAKVTINVYDNATSELFSTTVYPDDLQN